MKKGVSRIRVMYLNAKGELFLQFYPECVQQLEKIFVGYKVCESLQRGYQVDGEVSRVTQSGIALKNWRLV